MEMVVIEGQEATSAADGNLMATSGADAMVRLWPAASLREADAEDDAQSIFPAPIEAGN